MSLYRNHKTVEISSKHRPHEIPPYKRSKGDGSGSVENWWLIAKPVASPAFVRNVWRRTSKSPRAVLLAALATAERALPLYSHRNSPKKFTQHQLFACLVLKSFLKTDYRGVVAHLADCPSLVETLGAEHVFLTTRRCKKRRGVCWPPRRPDACWTPRSASTWAASDACRRAADRLDRPGVECRQRLLRAPPTIRSECPGKPWFIIAFPNWAWSATSRRISFSRAREGRGPKPDVADFQTAA